MPEIHVEKGPGNTGRTPPKKDPKPAAIQLPMTQAELREDAVNGVFQLFGLGAIMIGQYADAGAINMHGPAIAHEAAALAETNPVIAKGLDGLLQVGPYAGIVAVAIPFVMQIMVNHKIVPAEKLASAHVVKPEILESQVKTQMARQAMEALKQQKQAEQELEAMQAEWAEYQNGQNPE